MQINWNFKGYEVVHPNGIKFFGTQIDWNQTLQVRINEINATRHKEFNRHGEITSILQAPEKFRSLFESLEFYDPKTECIANKHYRVVYNLADSVSEIRMSNNHKIIIENYTL